MQTLIDGVKRFRRRVFPENRKFFERLAAKRQHPLALFITCADSRINPNLITQTEPGDLFLIRNVGNLVPPHGAGGSEAAAIEYSLEVLAIRDIVICGHSQCGAIQSLLDEQRLTSLAAVKQWCNYAEATKRIVQEKYPGRQPADVAALAAMDNVLVQIGHLATHPAVAARLAAGEVRLHGWYYDIGTGVIAQYDQALGDFLPLGGATSPPLSGAECKLQPAVVARSRELREGLTLDA